MENIFFYFTQRYNKVLVTIMLQLNNLKCNKYMYIYINTPPARESLYMRMSQIDGNKIVNFLQHYDQNLVSSNNLQCNDYT